MAARRIEAARILTPQGWTGPAAVVVDRGVVVSVEPIKAPVEPAAAARALVPGFIDLQVNGIDDVDVARADGEDWDRLDAMLLAQGVTSWCPTLVTAPRDFYASAFARVDAACQRAVTRPRPDLLGLHLEGPMLGSATGAHPPDLVQPVDHDWLAGLPDIVRLVTVGAEVPGIVEAIAALRRRGAIVSIGHSRPTEEQLEAAVAAGATMVTHLFNAMSGLDHRHPGLAAFALTDDRLWLGLIADGVHVHPRMIALAFRAAGPRILLVTDAVAWRAGAAGSVRLRLEGGAPRRADGTLAGTALTMDGAVRRCVRDAGVPLEQAVASAATVPAEVLGLQDRGRIAPGRRADLVALDAELAVTTTWVGGEVAFDRNGP